MLILTVLVFSIIIIALCKSLNRQRAAAGITGWIVSQDLNGNGRLYRDTSNGIRCKPDIISTDSLIEEKSSVSNGKPKEGDKLQVAATIIGIEGATGKKYENAELRYRDGAYKLDDLKRVKAKAINIIEHMRRYLANRIIPKGKPTVNKCRVCDFRLACPQSMAEAFHA